MLAAVQVRVAVFKANPDLHDEQLVAEPEQPKQESEHLAHSLVEVG